MTARRSVKGTCLLMVAVVVMAHMGAAATLYVANGGGHVSPFASWANASTNLKNAIDLANGYANLSTVWVSNDVYVVTNEIEIKKTTVLGYGGDRAAVIISGGGSVRPFYLSTSNSVLAGLTVSNGYVTSTGDRSGSGAGVYAAWGALISNCVVTSCRATNVAGGVLLDRAGSVMRDCLVVGNTCFGAAVGAAGAVISQTALAFNCVISNNQGMADFRCAGGACASSDGVISNCTIVNNRGVGAGGVVSYTGKFIDCVISGNVASNPATDSSCGGGVYNYEYGMLLRNCQITDNRSYTGYRAGGGIAGSKRNTYVGVVEIQNCTIANNSRTNLIVPGTLSAGGIYFTGTNIVTGCVIYSNVSRFASTWDDVGLSSSDQFNTNYYAFNCVGRSSYALPVNQGNITSNPLFANAGGGDYRLRRASPCINTGTNQDWMWTAFDLDGNSRIDRGSGKVDMGAYEFPLPGGTLILVR